MELQGLMMWQLPHVRLDSTQGPSFNTTNTLTHTPTQRGRTWWAIRAMRGMAWQKAMAAATAVVLALVLEPCLVAASPKRVLLKDVQVRSPGQPSSSSFSLVVG